MLDAWQYNEGRKKQGGKMRLVKGGMKMNYIKSLQEQLKEEQEKRQELEDKISELKHYLNLDKFKSGELEGYVNVKDVFLRLN